MSSPIHKGHDDLTSFSASTNLLLVFFNKSF